MTDQIDRDPESADRALGDAVAPGANDPAKAELEEATVAPVGVAAVDVVAIPPNEGRKTDSADGVALPGRWVLTDAEIRPIIYGVSLAMFIAALNQTIIATALPTIGRDFRDFDNLPWLITAYLVTSTVAAPLCGKLSDIYGRRLVMMSALGLFMLGSIACALAPNMLALIIFRGLQGFGGGGLVPLVQATMADAVAPRERGRYQAYIGTVWVIAGVLGPVIGGYIADHLHWSVAFWINVPLGLAAAYMINSRLKLLPQNHRKHKLDLFGATLMMSSTIALLLALSWGGVRYPWFSTAILALVGFSIALTLAFSYRLRHEPEPFLPLSVLANPVMRYGTAAASFAVAVSIALTVFMPLYYENVHHLTAGQSGLALIPIAVMTTPGSVMSGRIMMRFDSYKWFGMSGLVCATLAIASLAVWPRAPLWAVIIALCVFGMGIGTVFSMSTVSVQNAVSRFEVGTATGTMNFFRSLVSALVVAIMGAIILAGIGGEQGRAAEILAHISAHKGGAPVDLSEVFRWVFAASVVFLLMSIAALIMMEERPLRGRSEAGPKG
ncbi:MAG TPA: MDR family MFS transporter [Xanthobacteraceae bacterium]|nr:MDR family MFS transporter [Xanthobacteraceae bacterium]